MHMAAMETLFRSSALAIRELRQDRLFTKRKALGKPLKVKAFSFCRTEKGRRPIVWGGVLF